MKRIPPPMDADMRAFVRWLGSSSEGARVVEAPGVVAAVVPAAPERSILNSVVYDDAGALEAALPDLARAYAEAGCAWTVWVPEGDRAAAELLERAGHAYDGNPAAMVCRLADLDAPPAGDLDWVEGGDVGELAAVNDAAYGYPGAPFSAALSREHAGARVWLARRGGRTVCGLATLEAGGSAGVYWVATVPEERGQGLAGRLLGRALLAARERGCHTATLQASQMGKGLYERLGFRAAGRLHLWERRDREHVPHSTP